VVLTAVAQDGYALLRTSATLTGDRDVVLAAMMQNGSAQSLQYASATLREDREFMLAAAAQNGHALRYASATRKGDREVVLAAVAQNVSALQHASATMKGDCEVVLAAVAQNGLALCYASATLKGDREVVLAALAQDCNALMHASVALRRQGPELRAEAARRAATATAAAASAASADAASDAAAADADTTAAQAEALVVASQAGNLDQMGQLLAGSAEPNILVSVHTPDGKVIQRKGASMPSHGMQGPAQSCLVEGCTNKAMGQGSNPTLCRAHKDRWRKGEELVLGEPSAYEGSRGGGTKWRSSRPPWPEVEAAAMAGLAAVKVELDVEGLPAPPLPGDAPGRAGTPAEAVAAEVKSEQHPVDQVKVEIKTEVKSEITVTTVPPEGDATVLAAKRRRVGGAAPSGGAFCRRSRPRVPALPPVAQPPRQPIATATTAAAESVPEPHTSHAFDKPAPRRHHPWKTAACEDCRQKAANWGLSEGQMRRWCSECAKSPGPTRAFKRP
jgi:hypothetical protein